MTINIINSDDEKKGKAKLEKYYAENLIPAEKKPYVTALRKSVGPYMALESAKEGSVAYMQDAASQIATLGLGFNPMSFFGTAHFLESWGNLSHTHSFQELRNAFTQFLTRQLGWKNVFFRIGHSGAEANEIALGECFRNRHNKRAKHVLAFEGSFHGRMMVTLSATWNKAKREPFEWPGFSTVYCSSPDLPDESIHQPIPKDWRQKWETSPNLNWEATPEWSVDLQTAREVQTLQKVREHLLSEEIFAIIIEPMQCEGGDRYLSDRFFTALLLMARSCGIPVILDEVQTGFHLGREFFWHRQLKLQDQLGNALVPNYVVCAKKAQVGLVISNTPVDLTCEEFQVASFIRGTIHAQMLEQSQKAIWELERDVRNLLIPLISKYSEFIHRPRCNGMAFAFDVRSEEFFNKFIDIRFPHGLLYYNAGTHTMRFRLNLAYGKEDLQFLFSELDKICAELFLQASPVLPKQINRDVQTVDTLYQWHEFLLALKLDYFQGRDINVTETWNKGISLIRVPEGYQLTLLNHHNFKRFAESIDLLQKNIYEPDRQASLAAFEMTAKDAKGIAIVISKDSDKDNSKDTKIAAMTFASPLKNYPLVRGVRRDPYFNDPDCYYVIDTTVAREFQRAGLGHSLKYALTLAALLKRAKRINGRNRHIIAKSMWNINLSLGSYELDYIREDSPDFADSRDVTYYTMPAQWNRPPLHLCTALPSPLGVGDLAHDFITKNLHSMVNKVCLSNFVSESYLENFKFLISLAPPFLQHAYSCSGQAECADKIAKSFWYNTKKNIKNITFEGHFFGHGSFFARSLGQFHSPYFPVSILPNPTEDNWEQVLQLVQMELEQTNIMAVWLEPIRQRYMDAVPITFLKQLKELCSKFNVPLVYNETTSSFFRYQNEHFFAANNPEICPDAFMTYGGGQIGAVWMRQDLYVSKPLMLISTWDGDELSLATYTESIRHVLSKKHEFHEIRRIFNAILMNTLSECRVKDVHLGLGYGHFMGIVPTSLQHLFSKVCIPDNDEIMHTRYLICPNFDSMLQFIRKIGNSSEENDGANNAIH
ncbi:MAG: aminotransferase class III-fold pyridoxal phosphate-dependent enzyme [Bdellovibrio sp.]|nr:aminotransferase class III-fold pyridoxal phosphate-dependent enzyme [Bdellovibrio sp.]